jgi:MFS family permease
MLAGIVGVLTLLVFTVHLNNSTKIFRRYLFLDRSVFLIFAIALLIVQKPVFIVWLYGVYYVFFSIMSFLSPNYIKEAIHKEAWGRVFAHNKMILVGANLVTLLIAGKLLDHFNYLFPYNFIIMFVFGSISYFISSFFAGRLEAQPIVNNRKENRLQLLKNIDKMMIVFLIVQTPMYLIGPLWSIYRVRTLGLNNYQISILVAAYAVGGIILLPFWGRLLDKKDNRKLYIISSFTMCILPLIFILNTNFYYLVLMHATMGVLAIGYDVILQNNLMDCAQRAHCDYGYLSEFQIFQNINRLIFPAVGIYLYSQIGIINAFLISALLRIIVAIVTLYVLRDNKEVALERDVSMQC